MKVSVITVCYNSSSTIESTIKSVLEQDYTDIEYLVIDGLSKDNTLEVVNRYKAGISKIISEKDKGIYDALNKGISLATGEVIAFLHADDFYAYPSVISDMVKEFEASGAEGVYADLDYVEEVDTSKIVRHWISGPYNTNSFLFGWMPPHPTFFVKRSVYEKHGNFNLELKSAADYELMLRFIHKNAIKLSYLPKVTIKMRVGGLSNKSFKNRVRANQEDRKAWEINNVKPYFFTLYFKPLRKIIQYFSR